MSDARHQEFRLLVQADIDGELSPREAATIVAHRDDCAECRALYRELRDVKQSLRAEAPYHAAPEDFRRRLANLISAEAAPRVVVPTRRPFWGWLGGSFGAGALVAASLLLLVVVPRENGIEDSVVDSHIRALQPGHLIDVQSSNQHTVKPWFDGRLDFAPPVKDLATAGYPLQGGRLDYIAGRPVAALIYGRAQHVIDLFVFPSPAKPERAPETDIRNGYNLIRWSDGQMNYWAVSDLNKEELGEFVRDWRAAP